MLDQALWLILALPEWYFETIFSLIEQPDLTTSLFVTPVIGQLCLIVGVIWGCVRPHRALLLVAAPILLSELLVGAAGWFRGSLRDNSGSVLLPFLGVVLILVAATIWRARGARWPAFFLGLFALSYALMAAFVGTMSFSDVWL
jgi:hypothetical protein